MNKDLILEYNNKILECIIDICQSHPPRYTKITTDDESLITDDYFKSSVNKFFPNDEIYAYNNKVQIIHDYKVFTDNDLFYKTLLDDFKLYIYKILSKPKKLALLRPNNYKYNAGFESIFNNNISFIYFYNFVLFLKNISNKFPKIINEDIYKIDMILIMSIFSPDYKVSFENGVIDKYGVNYESYTILMVELIDLIKDKKYYDKDIYEIEKYKFKYPKSWEVSLNLVEKEIINFFLYYNYINGIIINDERFKYNLNNSEYNQYIYKIKKIQEKIKSNEIDLNKLKQRLNTIISDINKSNSLYDKKIYIKSIIDNKNFNDNGILSLNEISSNLDILNDLYSLDENEFTLQLIYSFDLMESFANQEIKYTYQPSSFLNFINNRKIIINEIKNAKNYASEFREILSNKDFRDKIKIILNSKIVKKYYTSPVYYYGLKPNIDKFIGKKKFIDIYNNFLSQYIENDKIYDRIIIKRMPYGLKGAVTPYLSFIIDPFGVDMNKDIKDKKNYIEAYLIILFLHETNHFSKRSYYINKPLSICKTPHNCEGGNSIIIFIFGAEKIYIIDEELCKKVNDIKNWKFQDNEKIEEFMESLENIIKNTKSNINNEQQLIKLKNEKNCLICFNNFRDSKKNESKIAFPQSNGGLICF